MIHSLKCRGTFSTMGAKSFEELLNNSKTVEIEVPYQEIPRGDRYITYVEWFWFAIFSKRFKENCWNFIRRKRFFIEFLKERSFKNDYNFKNKWFFRRE